MSATVNQFPIRLMQKASASLKQDAPKDPPCRCKHKHPEFKPHGGTVPPQTSDLDRSKSVWDAKNWAIIRSKLARGQLVFAFIEVVPEEYKRRYLAEQRRAQRADPFPPHCEISDLNNEIHPYLRSIVDVPGMMPALRLTSKYLTESPCLPFWHAILSSDSRRLITDPQDQPLGRPIFHISRKAAPLTAYEEEWTRLELLKAAGHLKGIRFVDNHPQAWALTHKQTCCFKSSRKPLCRKNASDTRISIKEEFAWTLHPLSSSNDDSRLLAEFMLMQVLIHEIAHALWSFSIHRPEREQSSNLSSMLLGGGGGISNVKDDAIVSSNEKEPAADMTHNGAPYDEKGTTLLREKNLKLAQERENVGSQTLSRIKGLTGASATKSKTKEYFLHYEPLFEDHRAAELGFASAACFWKGQFEPDIKINSCLGSIGLGLSLFKGYIITAVQSDSTGGTFEESRWWSDGRAARVRIPLEYVRRQFTQSYWDETVRLRGAEAFEVPTRRETEIENPTWRLWEINDGSRNALQSTPDEKSVMKVKSLTDEEGATDGKRAIDEKTIGDKNTTAKKTASEREATADNKITASKEFTNYKGNLKKKKTRTSCCGACLFRDRFAISDLTPRVHSIIGNPVSRSKSSPRDIICHCDKTAPQHESSIDGPTRADLTKDKFVTGPWICPNCSARLRFEGIHDSWGAVWVCMCEGYYHLGFKDGGYRLHHIEDLKIDGRERWLLIYSDDWCRDRFNPLRFH